MSQLTKCLLTLCLLLLAHLATHLWRATKLKVATEIYLTYHLVVRQVLCRTRLKNLSLVEEVCAVGDGEGLVDVVVGDDNANVLILERAYDILDILNGDGVYTRKWLVEKDE